jgi:hypothetical protein
MKCRSFLISHILFIMGITFFSGNSVVAGNKEECSRIWKTPNEIKSCILIKGFENKSRYVNVLKRPLKPYGYRSFIFRPIKELLGDEQTHLYVTIELIVSHVAFQYLSIRDVDAEKQIKRCMAKATPKKPSAIKIKKCILHKLRTLTKRNYTWKQEPVWDIAFLDFKIQLQKRENLRNQ